MTEERVITEAYLRHRFQKTTPEFFTPGRGQILTPSARQYLKERRVCLVEEVVTEAAASRPPADGNSTARFVGLHDDKGYASKPEHLTHLRNNRLVPKDHPRIVFRGQLDRFLADLLLQERQLRDMDELSAAAGLEQIGDLVRNLIRADARDETLPKQQFLGSSSDEIHELSHHPQKHFGQVHPVPTADMSPTMLGLNRLRALVREVEISAVAAFPEGGSDARPDIIQTLNRMSSALYVLMLKSGQKTTQQAKDKSIKTVVEQVCSENLTIPVELSGRHVHLSAEDAVILFGTDLTEMRELSQPGQYLARERVTLIGPAGRFENVAVLGPARGKTQIEISRSDARVLGVEPPVRQSGDIVGTKGLRIIGEKAEVAPEEGLIVAARHIHMTPADAERLGVADGDFVKARVGDVRALVFEEILVRVNDNYRLSMHIDYDEGNACGWTGKTVACLLKD